MAKKISQKEAQEMLFGMVQEEVKTHEKGQFWITDKVAFNIRELIKQARKNYWGVYDDPYDQVTGEEKLWVPLTRTLVDAVRKNVDLDPKDVRFRAKHPKKTAITQLVRSYTRRWLSQIYFNHTLNQSIFTACIDGTDVWKTYTQDGKIVRKDVDLLNVYIDPTADSIQEAHRFTERVLMTDGEVKKMEWENVDKFRTEEDLEREDNNAARKTGKFGDVYESWGLYPKHLVLAAMGFDYNDADEEEEIESQVVISGLDTGAGAFHYSAENTNKDKNGQLIKPYEEAWYVKVPGRWYGVGIAETVMALQEWINTVVNLRIKKNTLSQLGLLKVRRGSKVTQQMLKNLVSKGVIELADPERDLQQLQIAESGQGSYQDEQTAKGWAQDVTAVFDVSLSDMPASTSATGAVIQDRQQRSAYALVTESFEDFIQRWVDRHVLPNVPNMIKQEDYVTFFSDFEDIKKVRESVVATLAMEELRNRKGVPTEQELQTAIQRAERKLEDRGDLFLETVDDILANAMETEVFMTNAEVDVAVTVRNLLELRNGLPQEAFAQMTQEALDLLGIQTPSALRNPAPQEGGQPEPENVQSEVQEVAAATTLNNEQR